MPSGNNVLPENWTVVHRLELHERLPQTFPVMNLTLSREALAYLQHEFPKGLYRHQLEAIQRYLQGENVCITTPTASGKSIPFYVAGLDEIAHEPHAKVLAVYPLRALGRQQEERWRRVLAYADPHAQVGRIDGQVPTNARVDILRNASVLIATPDILHAWLLPSAGNRTVLGFLRKLRLVVVDEVHSYTGVFGSNAAFLFRRLLHTLALMGVRAQFVCTSATMAEPDAHLAALFARQFTLIGEDLDTSHRHPLHIELVAPPPSMDQVTSITDLLTALATVKSSRFLAFVDSRKQTELIAAILSRKSSRRMSGEDAEEDLEELPDGGRGDHLQRLGILPYRAGYEEEDRDVILSRLSEGRLQGVVSTSALELGIDIAHLTTGVLVGVPHSSTSLLQRIGRIGRQGPGRILVVNTGDVHDERAFRRPDELLQRPRAVGALYLENSRIQYIHALCLAREDDGEHDQICAGLGLPTADTFASEVSWPAGFLSLCKQERTGEVPVWLQAIKIQAGDTPHLAYPLRDIDIQFKVEHVQGPVSYQLGSLSYDQVMREAYPGAVYYYATRPYRVQQIRHMARSIKVHPERYYTTKPQRLPTLLYPNLAEGNVYAAHALGDLLLVEANVQIRDAVLGFKERRGPNELVITYPTSSFRDRCFARNYFTTGVVLTHPALIAAGVDLEQLTQLASLLYEALLLVVPFERQDLSFAHGRFRVDRGPVAKDSRFIAIYDQTYGSLRLSSRLMEVEVLQRVFSEAREISINDETVALGPESAAVLAELLKASHEPKRPVSFGEGVTPPEIGRRERIILPGSRGWALKKDNKEFQIDNVFFSPQQGTLMYRGSYVDSAPDDTQPVIIWPISAIAEIPGESEMGYYDYSTGLIIPQSV